MQRARRIPWLWLLIVGLLIAFVVDIFLPVPVSASETTKTLRSQSLPLLGTGLVALIVFALQTGRARGERREERRLNAYTGALSGLREFTSAAAELHRLANNTYWGRAAREEFSEKIRELDLAEARVALVGDEKVATLLTETTYFCTNEVRPKASKPQDGDGWDATLLELVALQKKFMAAARADLNLS